MTHPNDSQRRRSRVVSLGFAVLASLGLVPSTLALAATTCTGDCANDGQVTVDELVTMVNIGLGTATFSRCLAGDGNQDGAITVDDILTAVTVALDGCRADSACDDHNPCTVDRFVSGGTCQHTLPVLPCTDGPAAAPMYVGV